MPSYFSRLFGAKTAAPVPEAKASRTASMVAMHGPSRARWTPRTNEALTREGYERNAIVYRAVRMIAEAAASVPWVAYDGDSEVADHPLLKTLAAPGGNQTAETLLEQLYTNLMLFGDAYLEAVTLDGHVREIYALRPDRMSLVPGRNGWPEAYDYTVGGERMRFAMNQEGLKPILHLKLFHPLDDFYGFAPMQAAQVALDIHNAAGAWNKALLDNSARPSGALVYGAGGTMTDDQFDRLKSELDESFSGTRNAGRPLLLEGGLDWKSMSLSPKDMDFQEAKAAAAREIALAFGIPPLVLGLPGDNTFSNYKEANRVFWSQTILPLVSRTQKSIAAWLTPAFGPVRLDYNADRIDALSVDREAEWRRVMNASCLTRDEQRAALGYGPLPPNTNL